MNYALILSGGTGIRLGESIPKQYIKVSGRMIIDYCLDSISHNNNIDGIVIVAAKEWQETIFESLNDCVKKKLLGFADAGSSRQHSIQNGLRFLKFNRVNDTDVVLIHDAARPNIDDYLIDECINGLAHSDGIMPVLEAKDTMYLSKSGDLIDGLLNRDELYLGQAPESYRFGKYYLINNSLTEEQLSQVRGSSEIAFINGLHIHLIPGKEENYKITTKKDLERFILEKEV